MLAALLFSIKLRGNVSFKNLVCVYKQTQFATNFEGPRNCARTRYALNDDGETNKRFT